jgi:hypothetical protein
LATTLVKAPANGPVKSKPVDDLFVDEDGFDVLDLDEPSPPPKPPIKALSPGVQKGPFKQGFPTSVPPANRPNGSPAAASGSSNLTVGVKAIDDEGLVAGHGKGLEGMAAFFVDDEAPPGAALSVDEKPSVSDPLVSDPLAWMTAPRERVGRGLAGRGARKPASPAGSKAGDDWMSQLVSADRPSRARAEDPFKMVAPPTAPLPTFLASDRAAERRAAVAAAAVYDSDDSDAEVAPSAAQGPLSVKPTSRASTAPPDHDSDSDSDQNDPGTTACLFFSTLKVPR